MKNFELQPHSELCDSNKNWCFMGPSHCRGLIQQNLILIPEALGDNEASGWKRLLKFGSHTLEIFLFSTGERVQLIYVIARKGLWRMTGLVTFHVDLSSGRRMARFILSPGSAVRFTPLFFYRNSVISWY